ncbi:GNAT family N-acetyltransferase [Desulfovibrio sp. JC010]|uniref:GNAT family N-acetyltransferase n=1 Tax=Desulfovibrio sp. JC010 TaxID=2593641 RepID=UPI0013D0DE9D|nr:GNAT family N-acetyltransferase [Desulfovibrio sp. JC010]NDV26709.1 GNAT family N-acetyltransferase [Desulfovibrio sp. JC010]
MSYFITGTKVGLRGLSLDDVDGNWFSWFNNPEITKYMYNGSYPNTREGLIKFYQSTCVDNSAHLVLAIIDIASGAHVGNLGLHRIDHLYRRAELGIVLGEKDFWGKGIGSEACKLICGHGFARFNLHKIFLRTEFENVGAIRAFEKAGFSQEAVLKEEIYRDGAFRDSVYMSCFSPY